MKIGTANMLSYENRNCKFAYVGKWKRQVGLVMKVEIASVLNYENKNCTYA